MKVGKLIEILEEMDPEAEVLIMSQQSWPFENTIAGVIEREEIPSDKDEDGEEAAHDGGGEPQVDPSDVFLCEGQQIRYGSKRAWESMHR